MTKSNPGQAPLESVRKSHSMYNMFRTDPELERNGVDVDFGSFVVTLARAGGGNKRFTKVLEQKTKQYRRAIQTETMDPELAEGLIREVYAEANILNWRTKVGEDANGERVLEVGIENPDGGKLLPFTAENVVKTLRNLPDLFTDLQQQSNKVSLYRAMVLEDDSKN